ncbi:hypothetical protein SL56_05083, partial [Klebsiella pneumoniae]
WKATAPDLTGHRPQIAGNRNADRIARPSPPLCIRMYLIPHSQIS